jgi:hypothetical protein
MFDVALTTLGTSYWRLRLRIMFQVSCSRSSALSCAEYKASIRGRAEQDELSEKWLEKYTMACFCGRWCEKTDGCDHITCPPRCGGVVEQVGHVVELRGFAASSLALMPGYCSN